MKKLSLVLGIIILGLSSCVYVINEPGQPGRNGRAYFGVSYEDYPPYSYWDNNPNIPNNPILSEYYLTRPGIYEFEYFVNEFEYWFGTYEVFINYGGPGGSYGEPGIDGEDSFLMLICDPYGFHEHRFDSYKNVDPNFGKEPLIIEERIGNKQYKITIQKANKNERPAHEPKLTNY